MQPTHKCQPGRRRAGRRLTRLAVVALGCLSGAAYGADKVTCMSPGDAVPASELLDSMGINTHFTFADSPYATRYAEVRAKLAASGLHHVRDVLNPHVSDLARLGIATTVLAEPNFGTPDQFRERIERLNAATRAVDAVEGANEPDMFWQRLHITWRGHGYPEGPALWQRDLYRVFKAAPATAKLTIIGPSLGLAGLPNATPPASWTGLRAFVDWGDFHPYPYNGNQFAPELQYGTLPSFFHNGTFPSVGLDQSPVDYWAYRTIYGPGPMAATESGYPTGGMFTSEALAAKYIVRLYLENFRLGIKRTYLYQLLDNIAHPAIGDPDGSFGLLRYDLSERPAFGAVAALAHLLAATPAGGRAVPPNLRLVLTVRGAGEFTDPSRGHHLLVRRPDGTLLLLLWHEVSGEDTSSHPRRPVTVPPLPARIEASTGVRFMVDGRSGGAAGSADFLVPDSVVAVAVSR